MSNETAHAFRNEMMNHAKNKSIRLAFPDAIDIRVLEAAVYLQKHGLAQPVLIGKRQDILNFANSQSFEIGHLEIIDPSECITQSHREAIAESTKVNLPNQEAEDLLMNPLFFAGIEARLGHVHGCIAGNVSTTGEVIRAGLKTVGLPHGIQTVSSFFIMILDERIMFFADCAVIPSPDKDQLCDIAYMTAQHYRELIKKEPGVAFLSFSTKGSASHPDVMKVQEAYAKFSALHPNIKADGELQIDAALMPTIAQKKAPKSELQGNANVLIFPDLDAGNIAYKITERLAGAIAIGPIIQGLRRPYCDLSRGCSVQDIIDVSLICSAM